MLKSIKYRADIQNQKRIQKYEKTSKAIQKNLSQILEITDAAEEVIKLRKIEIDKQKRRGRKQKIDYTVRIVEVKTVKRNSNPFKIELNLI